MGRAIMKHSCVRKGIRNISVVHRLACLLIALLVTAAFPAITAAADEKKLDEESPWSAEIRVKRYFGSHTSYEFGNPSPPRQAPLSRLEFPMNTWWVGGEARRSFPRFSVGVEVFGSIPMESDLAFKDSDWSSEIPSRSTAKDIYSEAQNRVEPSYMVRADVDLKISDWVGLPAWFDLRPVAGVRWQNLNFIAHNGVQVYPAWWESRSPDHYPGDAIRFEQTYWQYFLGMRTAYDLGRHIGVKRLKLLCQVDWAYVDGDNKDHHLLQPGNRWTYERTSGNAWHALIGIQAGLTKKLHAGLEFEYLQITTTGSHRWVHDVENADESWSHGVKAWSEQMSLMMSLGYKF